MERFKEELHAAIERGVDVESVIFDSSQRLALNKVRVRLVCFVGTVLTVLPIAVYLIECAFVALQLGAAPKADKLYWASMVGVLAILMYAFPGVERILRLPKK